MRFARWRLRKEIDLIKYVTQEKVSILTLDIEEDSHHPNILHIAYLGRFSVTSGSVSLSRCLFVLVGESSAYEIQHFLRKPNICGSEAFP